MKRILLTGGSGLLALNWAITVRSQFEVVLALHNREISLADVKPMKFDTRSRESILKAFEQIQPELIIHTAGLTSVEDCEKFPDLARTVNTDFASNVSSVCAELSIPLVHISTDHIFSGEFQFATEELPVNPIPGVITQLAAIANAGDGPLFVTGGQRHQSTLRVLAIFGDDINDAVHRVGAPQTAARTANDFDPFDIRQE